MQFIETLEEALGKKAIRKMIDMQAGYVKETSADTSALSRWVKFKPNTSIKKALSDLLTGIKSTTKLFLFRSFMCFMSFFIRLSFS
jgi:hypothetical protein